MEKGDFDTGLEYYQSYYRLKTKSKGDDPQTNQELITLFITMADGYQACSEYEKACEFYQKAISALKENDTHEEYFRFHEMINRLGELILNEEVDFEDDEKIIEALISADKMTMQRIKTKTLAFFTRGLLHNTELKSKLF